MITSTDPRRGSSWRHIARPGLGSHIAQRWRGSSGKCRCRRRWPVGTARHMCCPRAGSRSSTRSTRRPGRPSRRRKAGCRTGTGSWWRCRSSLLGTAACTRWHSGSTLRRSSGRQSGLCTRRTTPSSSGRARLQCTGRHRSGRRRWTPLARTRRYTIGSRP